MTNLEHVEAAERALEKRMMLNLARSVQDARGEIVALRDKNARLADALAKSEAYCRKMDGILEEVGGVAISCINPYEDLKRAMFDLKFRAEGGVPPHGPAGCHMELSRALQKLADHLGKVGQASMSHGGRGWTYDEEIEQLRLAAAGLQALDDLEQGRRVILPKSLDYAQAVSLVASASIGLPHIVDSLPSMGSLADMVRQAASEPDGSTEKL